MSRFFNKTRMKETERSFKGKTNKEIRAEKKFAKEEATDLLVQISHRIGAYTACVKTLRSRGLRK